MSETIEDLRGMLFATIKGMQDEDKPLDLDRAKMIVHAASVIVDSAKVEVDFARVTGGTGSGFIKNTAPALARPDAPKPNVTVHRLKG